MTSSALNQFDGIVYINLAARSDRRKFIEKQLKKACIDPCKSFRIDAIHDELNGCRGCVYSHIKALDFALERSWNNVLVLEDDALFIDDHQAINAYIHSFFDHFKQDWDVFFLGTRTYIYEKTSHPAFVQVRHSWRAHAYVVNGPYIQKLRDHYLSTYKSMEEDLFYLQTMDQFKQLDAQWVKLQEADRWFAGEEMIAKQKRCFSDIEKHIKPRR